MTVIARRRSGRGPTAPTGPLEPSPARRTPTVTLSSGRAAIAPHSVGPESARLRVVAIDAAAGASSSAAAAAITGARTVRRSGSRRRLRTGGSFRIVRKRRGGPSSIARGDDQRVGDRRGPGEDDRQQHLPGAAARADPAGEAEEPEPGGERDAPGPGDLTARGERLDRAVDREHEGAERDHVEGERSGQRPGAAGAAAPAPCPRTSAGAG